jgi:hypothetical protein
MLIAEQELRKVHISFSIFHQEGSVSAVCKKKKGQQVDKRAG